MMKFWKLPLHTKIFIGLLAGVLFGLAAKEVGLAEWIATYIKPVGTIFIKLITLIVVPLVFASLLVGTASIGDIKKLGRIGLKTFVYFIATTVIAITIGVLIANIVKPGAGFPTELRQQLLQEGQKEISIDLDQLSAGKTDPNLPKQDIKDILIDIIPANPVKSLAEGNMLQIIFFALICGLALTLISTRRSEPVLHFFEGFSDLMIQMVHIFMKLAPYGVFALIAAIVSQFGFEILTKLIKYSLVVIAGLIIQLLVIYPLLLKIFTKTSIRGFFKAVRPAQLIAFSTSSSSATLPVSMECTKENLGVSNQITSFVLPLGATINMDGTALYQAVAAIFIAQIYNIPLDIGQQLTIILTATLASIGTPGTPGVGIIMLIMVLTSVGLPPEGIAIILGVDRLLDMCRTVLNVSGDMVGATIVATTEGEKLKV
jgi:proton glutamate symport protein